MNFLGLTIAKVHNKILMSSRKPVTRKHMIYNYRMQVGKRNMIVIEIEGGSYLSERSSKGMRM